MQGYLSLFNEQPDLAVKIWLHYNQKILNFYQHCPDRCLLMSVETVAHHANKLIESINQQFALDLHIPNDLYDPTLLKHLPDNDCRLASFTLTNQNPEGGLYRRDATAQSPFWVLVKDMSRPSLINYHFPDAIDLYETLEAEALTSDTPI